MYLLRAGIATLLVLPTIPAVRAAPVAPCLARRAAVQWRGLRRESDPSSLATGATNRFVGWLLGCVLIGVIEPFADYYLPGIKGVSAYVVMLIVLFVRPDGLIVQTYQKKV